MKKIKNLDDLMQAAKEKKSVVSSAGGFNPRIPAAFAVNMTGAMIHSAIKFGLYIYEPKTKTKKTIRKGFRKGPETQPQPILLLNP